MDFQKLRPSELNERICALKESVAETRAERQAVEGKAATLQAQLLQLGATLQRSELRAADLQSSLLEASRTIHWQQHKLAAPSTGGGDPAYRRVGLHKDCPEFVLQAVRHAYAKKFHPDHTLHEKAQAEETLKEANAALDTIFELRKHK
jgi:hypothetical protein